MKVTIIGAGNMGGAVARGMAKGTCVKASDITLSNPSQGKLEAIKSEFRDIRITNDNIEAVKDARIIFLAVKPWKIEEVINQIKPYLNYSEQVIASMVGGIGLQQISDFLQRKEENLPAVYYLIPNTAIAVMSSMTFISSTRSTDAMDKELLAIFSELGDAMLVEERLMGAGMALASCGIAYAMRYIRAATEGGVELGMYAQDAQRIVMQTLKGAVDLLQATGNHPEAEIDKVTTPGGITIRGLNEMEHAGFTGSVIRGLKASLPR